MTIRVLSIAGFFLSAAMSFAQDPTKVAPDAYKLRLENELVKVTRVHYAAHSKVPVHDHSRWPAAYVYLNDAGPVIFSHTDWQDPVLTRPPVKARSFRLSPTTAAGETHKVENPGDTPSDFLRIEFKMLIQGSGLPHRRVPPEQYTADKNFSKVHFENDLLRITRIACPRGQQLTVKADASGPAMLVILSAARTSSTEGKSAAYQPGETLWLAAGESKLLENFATSPFELLRFDFKSRPPKSKDAVMPQLLKY